MPTIVWLGPAADATALQPLLSAHGLELAVAADAAGAVELALARGAVAVIAASDSGVPAPLTRLARERPEVQVIAATRLGVPAHVSAALEGGATDVIDLAGSDAARTVAAIGRSLARHRRAVRQQELLLRMRALNEDFLRQMVVMDRRNMELEESLQGETGLPADGPRRVLVVDDEASLAALLQMVLADRGYDVVVAEDAESGLAAFRVSPVHVVVTDKNLPGTDGLALLREVKRLRPDTDVIVITAYGSKDSAVAALNAGASAYLEKPFDDIEDVGRKVDVVVAAQRDRARRREFLRLFKERNREFLEQYKTIRAELEAWLAGGAGGGV